VAPKLNQVSAPNPNAAAADARQFTNYFTIIIFGLDFFIALHYFL